MSGTIAVVGANGFIGGRTIEMMCLSEWAEPRPVARRPEALAHACRLALDARVADARDEVALRAAFEGCRAVLHAVAGDPDTILGTLRPVYRAAQAAGVQRIVYLSTASVHGQDPEHGTDETSRLSDRQAIAYNNAKVRAEACLLELRQGGLVEIVLLRPGIVYGPRSFWTGGFADELLAGEAYLVGGGRGICNCIYVDNLVHAIKLAMDANGADGRAYLVGDAEEVTWADLCRPVVEALGYRIEDLPDPPVGPARPPLLCRLRGSSIVTKSYRRLPKPLRQGLKAGYSSWRAGRALGGVMPVTVPVLQASQERALLHRCRYRLQSVRAQAELGYRPILSFAEGCRRSVGWLEFAGYPVIDGRSGV